MATLDPHLYSDQELLSELLKGDDRALRAVYARYWNGLYNRAFNILGEEEVCKDVIQELFISLWDKPENKKITHLKAYLYQALKYRCFSELRKRYTSEKHMERFTYLLEQVDDTSENLINLRQTEEGIQEALQKLPRRCREVFELSRFEYQTSQQIADKMNISIKTVENQKTKAIRMMRKALKDYLVILLPLIIS